MEIQQKQLTISFSRSLSEDNERVEEIDIFEKGFQDKKISLLNKHRVIKNKLFSTKDKTNQKSKIEELRKKLLLRKKHQFQEQEKENFNDGEDKIFQKKKVIQMTSESESEEIIKPQKNENHQKIKQRLEDLRNKFKNKQQLHQRSKTMVVNVENNIETLNLPITSIPENSEITQPFQQQRLKRNYSQSNVEQQAVTKDKNLSLIKSEEEKSNDENLEALEESVYNKSMEIVPEKSQQNLDPQNSHGLSYETYDKKVLKILDMNLENMKSFIKKPPPKGKIIQLTIIRDRSGFKNKFYPKYLIVFSENINHHVMSAKKKYGNKSTNIVFSLSKNDFNRKSENCLGKLRSNFVGTQFHIYDKGENPKKLKKNDNQIRKELGFIQYDKNIFGLKGPRKLKVCIPKFSENEYQSFTSESKYSGIKYANKQDQENVNCFLNKPPQWNKQMQAFVLDFYNRVNQASVKNFQLIPTSSETQDFVLQFGKVKRDVYNLDFMYPFSLYQAVGIALSSCEGKLFCEQLILFYKRWIFCVHFLSYFVHIGLFLYFSYSSHNFILRRNKTK